MTLLSLSCEGEDGLTVAAALKSLFLEHGAPLVRERSVNHGRGGVVDLRSSASGGAHVSESAVA
jgi:hypothetical protein